MRFELPIRIDVRGVHRLEIIARGIGRGCASIEEPAGSRPGTEASRRARLILARRRERERLLGAKWFADPAWDMLLDLFATQEEGKRVSVSSLCIAACVPPTTALRWIKEMEAGGLVRKGSDGADGRRLYVTLTPSTARSMRELLGSWGDEGEQPLGR